MIAHNLAKYDAPTADDLRAQAARLVGDIRIHRARGIWDLANLLELDLARTKRALRRLESIEPKSGVHRRVG